MRFFLKYLLPFLAIFCFFTLGVSQAHAANYTPALVEPAEGATDVMPDGKTFTWEVVDPADSYVVEWCRANTFAATDMLFIYTVQGYTYTLYGLPGSMTIYWRVTASKSGSTYQSSVGSFTTLADNESIVYSDVKSYDFATKIHSDWSISDGTVFYYSESSGTSFYWNISYPSAKVYCMVADGIGYYSMSGNAVAKFDVPTAGGAVKYDWSYSTTYNWGNDELYIEYSLNGSTYTKLYMHSPKTSNADTGWVGSTWSSPTSADWKTNLVELPADCNGKTVYVRFRLVAAWGWWYLIDNVKFQSKSAVPKLTVFSDHGAPAYLGNTQWNAGTRLTPTCPQIVAGETLDRQYFCSGWTGSGSVPVSGIGNTIRVAGVDGFLIYRTSTITWQWTTMYRIIVSSTNGYGNPNPTTGYHLSGADATFTTDIMGEQLSEDSRYAFSNWSGTGCCSGSGTSNIATFNVKSAGTLTWNYKLQYRFLVVSEHEGSGFLPPIGENWMFRNAIIKAECPDFVDKGSGIGFLYDGYSCTAGIPQNQNRPIFVSLTEPMVLTWKWTPVFFLSVITPYGAIHGSQPGWYLPGTDVTTSIDEYIETMNARIRWNAIGYTATGDVTGGQGFAVPTFQITQPTAITFEWAKQHYCLFTSNAGTTTPTTGWYTENDILNINAMATDIPNETRYFFQRWEGLGQQSYSGTAQNATISIKEPLDQRAIWNIEHMLVVININGSILPANVSGWYPENAPVTVTAVPESAAAGTRLVTNWYGTGNGAKNIPASNNSPDTVVINVNSPIVQRVEWIIQYNLIIANPDGYGFTYPAPGTYWYFDDAIASGYCSKSSGDMICTGYTATGSVTGASTSFFSFPMTQPTTLTWTWGDRPAPVAENWGSYANIVNGQGGPLDIVRLPDGRLVVYVYIEATDSINRAVLADDQWNIQEVVPAVGGVSTLDASCDQYGQCHVVFYRDEPMGLVYFKDASFSVPLKVDEDSGFNMEEVGILGVRSSIIAYNDEIYVSYFDVADTVLKVAHRVDGVWTTTVVDTNDGAGFFNSIAVPSYSGLPIIAFARSGGAKGLYLATFDGENWIVSNIVSEFAGYFCSMVLDEGGVPHIAYQSLDGPGANSLHCASYIDGIWQDVVVDSNGDTGYNTSITIDNGGYLHIAYTDRNNLRYARQTKIGWEKRTLVTGKVAGQTGISFIGNVPAILFLYDGKPSYIDATGKTTNLPNGGDPTTSGSGSGGCFVATAAFGSMASNSVVALTQMRDSELASSSVGYDIVALYYAMSPYAAGSIADADSLRALLQYLLK